MVAQLADGSLKSGSDDPRSHDRFIIVSDMRFNICLKEWLRIVFLELIVVHLDNLISGLKYYDGNAVYLRLQLHLLHNPYFGAHLPRILHLLHVGLDS